MYVTNATKAITKYFMNSNRVLITMYWWQLKKSEKICH